MTHRIDQVSEAQKVRVIFQGLLDRSALSALQSLCASRRQQGNKVTVVLGAGTRIETGLMDEILGIPGVEITAESPFLSQLIAGEAK